jgi:ATP-binding cassette subfamily F protein uup
MDEPTNDLDIETIELLEERLLAFDGTLLLVSHDRAFLNNVVTATYALDGDGCVTEYAGGCDKWLEEYEARLDSVPTLAKGKKPVCGVATSSIPSPRKLRNKERDALKTLPALIETLETERDHLAATLNSPEYYRDSSNDPTRDAAHLSSLETRISDAYEQWGALETLAADQ